MMDLARDSLASKVKTGGIGVGGVGVGGYAVGGLDSGEKRFLRGINHSPAQMKLAENYGGMMRHKLGQVHMLPYHPADMEGSGIFSSLLGSLGLGVTDDNLHMLQQLEHKIEEKLPLEHKGSGRMLIHHIMRHKHKKHHMKGAGWFDDIVKGFTGTFEKVLPLVPHIIPLLSKL
jgi:hypothetical protein